MAPLFSDYGCKAMLAGNTGCQMGGWYRKEIKTLADLKGMKMRIGGMAGLVLAKLGVVPQLIGGPDIYPALEKGTIDAAEWVGPYDDEKNEIPTSYQAALAAACGDDNQWTPAKYDAQNPEAMRRLIASGTKLRRFPQAVMEAAEKASYELYEELKAKSKHWARIYPEWLKFRDEQFQWFRVAEATYDNYVLGSKVKHK
jgi:TRAP-type mannitol/chloroaromatic compound transport system substrate-binding protein